MVTLNPSQATRTITISAVGTQIFGGGMPASVYENESFNIACLLRDGGGVPVIGRTVDFYYVQAGSPVYLGSDITGDAGNAELLGVSIPTLGQTFIRYEFSGDAIYDPCWAEDGPFEVLPSVIDTTLTILAPASVEVNELFEIQGQLTRNDTGEGVGAQAINLSYNGVNLGSPTTDGGGFYFLSVTIAEAGAFNLTAEFLGTSGASAAIAALGIRVGVFAAHTVKGHAFTWPFPPGSVEAEVMVGGALYKTPFEADIIEGSQIFKATYNDCSIEETVTIDKDLTILFLFDPILKVLCRIIVAPSTPLPLPVI